MDEEVADAGMVGAEDAEGGGEEAGAAGEDEGMEDVAEDTITTDMRGEPVVDRVLADMRGEVVDRVHADMKGVGRHHGKIIDGRSRRRRRHTNIDFLMVDPICWIVIAQSKRACTLKSAPKMDRDGRVDVLCRGMIVWIKPHVI
mmetsp:Transcript_6968/g.15385  ORF Transcript_6968/g.15385 Transcript_6968/m.15385 type:complete len:144 (+) Transcript_6968:1112-1543(+)